MVWRGLRLAPLRCKGQSLTAEAAIMAASIHGEVRWDVAGSGFLAERIAADSGAWSSTSR